MKKEATDPHLSVALKMTGIENKISQENINVFFDYVMVQVGIERGNTSRKSVTEEDFGAVLSALEMIKAITYTRIVTEKNRDDENARYEVNVSQFGLRYRSAIKTIMGVYRAYEKRIVEDKYIKEIEKNVQFNVEGHLLEEVIISHLTMKYGRQNVYKCRLYSTKEIDIVVDRPMGKMAIEVKRSGKIDIKKPVNGRRNDQIKWLVDKEMNNFVEKYPNSKRITERIVVYTGKTRKLSREETYSQYEIEYVNAEEFMDRIGI